MEILFLHGWQPIPGGVKPSYLKDHGYSVINPKLPDDDFENAVRIAQHEFDEHQPDVVVGSSRGGAVAMNINSGEAKLVLLCPAWKKWGTATTVKPGTVILHSRADEVVPFAHSEELIRNSRLTANALIEVGTDHRLADPEPLEKMLEACGEARSAGAKMVSKNLRQLGKLSLCVLISAPLIYGSYSFLNDHLGERFSPWWEMAGSLAFWSFSVGICIQLPNRLPLKQTLLDGIGLGLLTACVNFILLFGAMWIWLAYFFVS
jgi:alpha/beta hydrolase family protein